MTCMGFSWLAWRLGKDRNRRDQYTHRAFEFAFIYHSLINKLVVIYSSISYHIKPRQYLSLPSSFQNQKAGRKGKGMERNQTHSTKFPSGSLQYTLLILPLAPVLSTTPLSVFSGLRSTISTPFSINLSLTVFTSFSVRKHKSAEPALTF